MFSFEYEGKKFEMRLDELLKRGIDEITKGVFLAGEALRGDSMAMAPFDRGTAGGLVSTASTERPVMEGNEIVSIVGYNKLYAARLHEDMTLKIKQTKAAGGTVRAQKYLERPMKENATKYGKILADAYTRALS